MSKRRKLLLAAVALPLAVASLGYVLTVFDWRTIASTLKAADLLLFAGGGVTSVAIYCFIRAWRWKVLLDNLGDPVPFGSLYMCTVVAIAFAFVTPLQGGEAMKVEWLKRTHGFPRSAGYPAFIVERAFDLLVVLALAGAFSAPLARSALTGLDPRVLIIASVVAAIVLVLGIVVALRTRVLNTVVTQIQRSIDSASSLLVVALLTLAGWLAVGLGWWISMLSIGLAVGYPETLALMASVTLVGVLSLVPGAIGVSEMGIVFVLIGLGYQAELSQTGSIAVRAYGIITVLFGAVHALAWWGRRGRQP